MHVQMAVDIEAAPDKVWPYLVEPDKTMQWYTMLKKFEYTSEDAGPDSTFYWEEDVRGKIYSNHFRTTEWVENRVFAYEMTSGNFFKSYTERWGIEETPTGSRFSFMTPWSSPTDPLGRSWGGSGNAWQRNQARRSFRISSVWQRRPHPKTERSRHRPRAGSSPVHSWAAHRVV